MISIHKALAGLDVYSYSHFTVLAKFQSTRPSRASTNKLEQFRLYNLFQSTRPSRASTFWEAIKQLPEKISIHKALAGLDVTKLFGRSPAGIFQSTRPSRASTGISLSKGSFLQFQSTRPSRASTIHPHIFKSKWKISIHKALAGLDWTITYPWMRR